MIRLLLFSGLCCLSLSLAGQDTEPRGFFTGLQYNYDLALRNEQLFGSNRLTSDISLNLLFGYRFNDRWEAGLSPAVSGGSARANRYNFDLYLRRYLGRPEQRLRGFLDGAIEWDGPFGSGQRRALALALGGGAAYQVSPRFSFTFDLRYYRGFNNFDIYRVDREDGTFFIQVDEGGNSSYGELRGALSLRYHFGKRNRNRNR